MYRDVRYAARAGTGRINGVRVLILNHKSFEIRGM
jgi:hypothetical protein